MRFERIAVGELQANCYVLFDPQRSDAVVIDPGAEEPAIRMALSGRSIAAILLTHGHYDHIGAVAALRADGAPVYIHAGDAPMLTNPLYSLAAMFSGKDSQGEADALLKDGQRLSLAGLDIGVLHTPGHTKGSCCFLVEDTLFSGDTLFRFGYGRTDLPGGDEGALFDSLKRLFALDAAVSVQPGHGAPTTIGAER